MGACFAYFDRTSFDGVSVEGGDCGDDEGEEYGFYVSHPHVPFVEFVLQADGKVVGDEDVAHKGGGIGAHDAGKYAECDKHGHHGHET